MHEIANDLFDGAVLEVIISLLDILHAHKTLFTTISVVSALLFVASLIALPIVVSRLPENYFCVNENFISTENTAYSARERLSHFAKNILGVILILAGISMLILPGQGLLTILVGVSVSNFSWKYKLQKNLVSQPLIFNSLNWVRHKTGKSSFQHPA